MDPSLYRPNVGIMLLNKKGNVFVAQRLNMSEPAWQMPQGGINEGEPLKEAALRELEEETSISKVEILQESNDWYFYDFPSHLQKKLWTGKYLGQRQKWFLMRYLGHNSEIDLQTNHPEFSFWKWVAPKDLPDLAVSFKKDIYHDLLSEFRKSKIF